MEILQLISDVGFPIAVACVGFFFVLLTLKFILNGVLNSIVQQMNIITQLNNRIASMSKDILKIDALASEALNLSPDQKISKIKEESTHRKD